MLARQTGRIIMAGTLKDDVKNAARAAGELARDMGHTMVEGTEKMMEFAKAKTGMGTREGQDIGLAGIKARMGVVASCGKTVGTVESVTSDSVKIRAVQEPIVLTRTIPFGMVDHVDGHVHLKMNSAEFEKELVAGHG